MPDKLPSKEELEVEMERAKRAAPTYRLRANGYWVTTLLAAIYVVCGVLYLSTLFDPSAPAAGDYKDAGTFFLATGLLMVGAFACTLLLMTVNVTLSRPADFLFMGLTLAILVVFYLISQWAKPQLGIS